MTQQPEPKRSETDPPAADRPVEPSEGAEDSPARTVTTDEEAERNRQGRLANDPSLSGSPTPETPQVPMGKPDGEVDTKA